MSCLESTESPGRVRAVSVATMKSEKARLRSGWQRIAEIMLGTSIRFLGFLEDPISSIAEPRMARRTASAAPVMITEASPEQRFPTRESRIRFVILEMGSDSPARFDLEDDFFLRASSALDILQKGDRRSAREGVLMRAACATAHSIAEPRQQVRKPATTHGTTAAPIPRTKFHWSVAASYGTPDALKSIVAIQQIPRTTGGKNQSSLLSQIRMQGAWFSYREAYTAATKKKLRLC